MKRKMTHEKCRPLLQFHTCVAREQHAQELAEHKHAIPLTKHTKFATPIKRVSKYINNTLETTAHLQQKTTHTAKKQLPPKADSQQ